MSNPSLNPSITSASGILQYSVDDGASFSDAVSPVTLLASQDMTKVQVAATLQVVFSDGTVDSKSTVWKGFPAASGTPTDIKLYISDSFGFDSSQAHHDIYEIWAEVTA